MNTADIVAYVRRNLTCLAKVEHGVLCVRYMGIEYTHKMPAYLDSCDARYDLDRFIRFMQKSYPWPGIA